MLKHIKRTGRKPLIASLLSVMLAASLLTGCGNIAKVATEQSESNAHIGIDKAISVVLKKVPGAKEADIHEIELDDDDGVAVYEGELVYNGYEYEFEIDAESGELLQWEIDED